MPLNPEIESPDPILSAPLAEQEAWWQQVTKHVVWRGVEPFATTVAAVLRNLAGNPAPEAVDALVQQAASTGRWDHLQRLLDARLLEARNLDPVWNAYTAGGEDPDGERLEIIGELPSAVGIDRILTDLPGCIDRSGRQSTLSVLGRARHAAAAQAVLDHLVSNPSEDDWLILYHMRLPAQGAEALLATAARLPDGDHVTYTFAIHLAEDGTPLEHSDRFLLHWRKLVQDIAEGLSTTDKSDEEWPDLSNQTLGLLVHAGELFPTDILEREVHWALNQLPIPEAINAAVETLITRGLPIDGIDLTAAATNPFTRPGLWSVLAEAGLSALFPPDLWDITGAAIAKVAHALDEDRRIRIPPAEVERIWIRPFGEVGHDEVAGSMALLRWREEPAAEWSLAAVGPFTDGPRLPEDLEAELTDLPATIKNIEDLVGELASRISEAAEEPARAIQAAPAALRQLELLIESSPGPERDLAIPAAVEALLDAARSAPAAAVHLEALTRIPNLALLDDCITPADLLLELLAEKGALTLTMLDRWRMRRDWKQMRTVAEDWANLVSLRQGLRDRLQGPESHLGVTTVRIAARIATAEPATAHRLLDAAQRCIGAEHALPEFGNLQRYLTLADAAAEQPEAIRHRLADILETEEYVPRRDDAAFIAWYQTLAIDGTLRAYTRYTVPGLERAATALPLPLPTAPESPGPTVTHPPAPSQPRQERSPDPHPAPPPTRSPRLLVIVIVVGVIFLALWLLTSLAPPGR